MTQPEAEQLVKAIRHMINAKVGWHQEDADKAAVKVLLEVLGDDDTPIPLGPRLAYLLQEPSADA